MTAIDLYYDGKFIGILAVAVAPRPADTVIELARRWNAYPDLLAACEDCVSMLAQFIGSEADESGAVRAQIEDARAAIKKARGDA